MLVEPAGSHHSCPERLRCTLAVFFSFFLVLCLEATVQQPQEKSGDVKFSSNSLHRCSSRLPRWPSPCPSAPSCLLGCSTCQRSMSSSSILSRTFRRGNEASRCKVASGSLYKAGSAFWSVPALKLRCVVAGCRRGRQNVPEIQRKAERRDKDRAWQVAVGFYIYRVWTLLTFDC